MVLSVYIPDWLDEEGNPVPRIRRRVLRIARLIEYGGPLAPAHMRETLVECSCRPKRRPCEGLLFVLKSPDGKMIEAWCPDCEDESIYITGWERTQWAHGPMEPINVADVPRP